MYRVCIPINNKKYNEKEKALLLRELKRAEADTVFVIFWRVLRNREAQTEMLQLFSENIAFLQQNGFKTGAWIAPTIGYGSVHFGDNDASEVFTAVQSIDGKTAKGAFCPLDDAFTAEFLNLMEMLAKTGVQNILFEDDFNLNGGKATLLNCCCEKHMQKFCTRIGETVSAYDLESKLLTGGKNKYRDAWCDLMGETLCDFASKIEKAVHEVDSDIRIGLSANASSYLTEGVTLSTLAKIIAGKTKPFIRMTGAPYWKNAVTLGPNIDAVRAQSFWSGEGIELLTEGDTYPRPRLWVPSAYLECYDMILRAEGKSHGILKYMIDYTYNADYETGYVERHSRNRVHYDNLEKLFCGKEPVGLNVFEMPLLFADEDFGTDIEKAKAYREKDPLPLTSQWFLSDNSIPTAYGQTDCASIVFGANAHHVDESVLKNGMILDAKAAIILHKKGIDVGIRTYQLSKSPMREHFIREEEYGNVQLFGKGEFYKFELHDGAEVYSDFIVKDTAGGFANISPYDQSGESVPACYRYENANGQRFMVYSFVADTVCVKSQWSPGLFRNYYRQKQLADGIEWLQRGKKLPAMCFKCPELYILCKRNEEGMTIGIWNLFADTVFTPEIVLDGTYKKASFYHCDGTLEQEKIKLCTDILPYDFAVITLYK